MKKIVFNCIVTTPMYSYGANKSTPEIRSSTIKSLIRIWWRILYKNLYSLLSRDFEKETLLDLLDLLNGESKIFNGDIYKYDISKLKKKLKKETLLDLLNNESKVFNEDIYKYDISKLVEKLKKETLVNLLNDESKIFGGDIYKYDTSDREFKKDYSLTSKVKIKSSIVTPSLRENRQFFNDGTNFKVEVLSQDINILEKISISFFYLSIFGGIGQETRKGSGSFRIEKIEFTGDSETSNFEFLDGLKTLISDFNNLNNADKFNSFILEKLCNRDLRLFNKFPKISKFAPIISQNNPNNSLFKFRKDNHDYKLAYLGLPVMGNNDINDASNVGRRASQLIFKNIKTRAGLNIWIVFVLKDPFLPENKLFKIGINRLTNEEAKTFLENVLDKVVI